MPFNNIFGAESVASVSVPFDFWYDREVRFDVDPKEIEFKVSRGEILLATFHSVEDTKGGAGEEGTLFVTNLRCIWKSLCKAKRNLSVGYNGIQSISVRVANLRLRGSAESLCINAKYNTSRFEFIFTYFAQDLRLSLMVRSVWRAYESTRMYRELRLRSLVIRDGNLILFSGEQLFTQLEGVSNITGDQGCIGTIFVTNLRIVWCARHSVNINVSIPFFHLTTLSMKSAKIGLVIAIDVSRNAGGFLFGFHVDPAQRLRDLFNECSSLWKTWRTRPILGVAVVKQDTQSGEVDGIVSNSRDAVKSGNYGSSFSGCSGDGYVIPLSATLPQPQVQVQDGENVVKNVATDAFAAYYVDVGQKGTDGKPEYDSSIGLAVEKLRDNVKLRDLWSVVM